MPGNHANSKSKKRPLIAPSLLAADLANLRTEIEKIEAAGADVLHIDVMDGHFVPNLTFGLPVIAAVRKYTRLPIDGHLMITNADQFIEQYAKAGCNWLSVHVEACAHLHRTVHHIRNHGMKAGVAINPGTSLSVLDGILDDIDFALLMSVNPGFAGQHFVPGSLDRLRELKLKIGTRAVNIEIDGGIKAENAKQVIEAGANVLVVGTGVFGQPDYLSAVRAIRGESVGAA